VFASSEALSQAAGGSLEFAFLVQPQCQKRNGGPDGELHSSVAARLNQGFGALASQRPPG